MRYRCRRHRTFKFDIKKAALIVIDMQAYFTNPSSHAYVNGSSKLIRNINRLIDRFNKAGRPVIFTRHIDIDKRSLMCRWWKEDIDNKDPLSRIDERLFLEGASIIVKHRYDAFFGTGLEKMLRKERAEQLVVTGVVTHLCCETTARSSFMRDILPFFVTDATGAHKKGHHEASVFNLSRGFAIPVTTDELLL